MFGRYPIMIDGEQLGELTVQQDGIMTLFEANCADTAYVLRLSVYGDTEGYLGVMMPDGEGRLHLRKRLSRAALKSFPREIRFVGKAGQMPEQQRETQVPDEVCVEEVEEPEQVACGTLQTEPEVNAAQAAYTDEAWAETDVQWRRAAGGALVGVQGQTRYLAVPLKSGVSPVGGNFEKRCIDQVEYAVFEIKNGKII